MMAELFGKRDRLLQGQGRLDAYRRFRARHPRRQRDRRRRHLPIATGVRAGRADLGTRRRHGLLLRRRRLQRGHVPRIAQSGGGLEAAGGLRLREQRLRRIHPDADRHLGQGHRGARARPTRFPDISSMATTCSRSIATPAKRSRGRGPARGRRCSSARPTDGKGTWSASRHSSASAGYRTEAEVEPGKRDAR